MEDAYIVRHLTLADGKKAMLFGVFDGHGGKEVSQLIKLQYQNTLVQLKEFKEA